MRLVIVVGSSIDELCIDLNKIALLYSYDAIMMLRLERRSQFVTIYFLSHGFFVQIGNQGIEQWLVMRLLTPQVVEWKPRRSSQRYQGC
jgi:hypothetical protein